MLLGRKLRLNVEERGEEIASNSLLVMDDEIDIRKRVLPRLATAATAQHLKAAQKEIDRVWT
jgi:hypothetical protein